MQADLSLHRDREHCTIESMWLLKFSALLTVADFQYVAVFSIWFPKHAFCFIQHGNKIADACEKVSNRKTACQKSATHLPPPTINVMATFIQGPLYIVIDVATYKDNNLRFPA